MLMQKNLQNTNREKKMNIVKLNEFSLEFKFSETNRPFFSESHSEHFNIYMPLRGNK